MKVLFGGAALFVLVSCASLPGPSEPRTVLVPHHEVTPSKPEFALPSPSWPVRQGPTPPAARASSPSAVAFLKPEGESMPIKQSPAPRSSEAKAPEKSALPVPTTAALLGSGGKNPAKAPDKPAKAAQGPSLVPVVPAPGPRPVATPPPTAAATASLLPGDKTSAPDFHWEEVNAVAGDAVTFHFDKTNWLYLDNPAQQKILGFQSITRDKDSTTFQFRPLVPGQYSLVFQRQDLANQANDVRRIRLTVVPVGTRTATTGTALAPQTSTVPPADPLETSRQLAANGQTSEAVQKLLEGYRADDARTNLALAKLLDQSGQDDQALGYLDRNLTLPGPDFQGTLELGTRLAAGHDRDRRLPTYVKLWLAGTSAPPEDLYLQVFEALRAGNLKEAAKEWSTRYASWYPEPQSRDRYLFTLGQLLETPGTLRDIRGAWKAYNEIVESYPLSHQWKAAGERAAYLNRYFLQGR